MVEQAGIACFSVTSTEQEIGNDLYAGSITSIGHRWAIKREGNDNDENWGVMEIGDEPGYTDAGFAVDHDSETLET